MYELKKEQLKNENAVLYRALLKDEIENKHRRRAFLNALNIDGIEALKIKLSYIEDGVLQEFAKYPRNMDEAYSYAKVFSDENIAIEFKIKGYCKNNKISILCNFTAGYIQIKMMESNNFTDKDVKKIINKIIK